MAWPAVFDDLDAALRALLTDPAAPADLRRADISFATPGKDYAPALPTVNLFLRDVHEDTALRDAAPVIEQRGDSFALLPPPLRVACSYLVTTWADPSQAAAAQVLDEHRMLGQALAWLHQFPAIPASYLPGSLSGQEIPPPVTVALPGTGTDATAYWIWSALGIAPRPSLDLSVTISMDVTSTAELGPPVLTSEVAIALGDTAPGQPTGAGADGAGLAGQAAADAFQIAGTVTQAGAPAPSAVVGLEPGGRSTVTDAAGRYSFTGLAAGQYVMRTTSADGSSSAAATVDVPATAMAGYDVSLPPSATASPA
jgi:Pvc16 N-terminal domain/Carboxypeptidase regulatory-like domain